MLLYNSGDHFAVDVRDWSIVMPFSICCVSPVIETRYDIWCQVPSYDKFGQIYYIMGCVTFLIIFPVNNRSIT